MKPDKEIITQFRENGLRVTPQRRLIVEILAETSIHPSVDDLYQQVKKKMPDISLATVYHTLHELVALGELKEVEGLAGESTRYDTNTREHHHLYCEKCHQIIDIEEDLGALQIPKKKVSGYLISRSQVTFYGICPKCQNDSIQ